MLFCKAFLGDLTPNGEKCGSKQVSPKGRNVFQKERNAKSIKSAFEVEVRGRSMDKLQVWGEAKGEIMDLGGVQVYIGCW